MTRLPPYLYVDRRLPDEESMRTVFNQRSLSAFGEQEHIERLHRVFYPAFEVRYAYESDGGFFSGTERKEDVALFDGLWAENDEALAQYAGDDVEKLRVSTNSYEFGTDGPGLGRSVLLQFQVTNDRAGSLLPERVQEYRSEVANGGSPDVFLRTLRERYGLAGDFDPEGFVGVQEVERVYLPFWLAEFSAEGADTAAIVTVRDDEFDEQDLRRHAWLAEFVSEEPRRLAEYGYQVDLERLQQDMGGREGDGRDRDRTRSGRSNGREPARDDPSSQPDDDAPRQPADREVVQPDDVDLTASSIVDPYPERTFADVGGMADLIETLRHTVVRPLEDPDTFERYGLGVVNGVLLHGPPGCGKTHVAGALAGEVGLPFISVTPADVTSKYMGEPAQNVADLFDVARANAPCVLFIDEIDGIGGARNGESDMNSSEQQMVNQLLTELEDVRDSDVVVVGATNLVEDVDPAIRRSGRFDERVEVPPPDAAARREILRIHLAGRPTHEDLSLVTVVEETAGYAASDLGLLAETAARAALRDEAPIGTEHLETALADVDSSIAGWVDPEGVEAGDVVQPDGVDLRARTLVEPSPDRDFGDVGGLANLKDSLEETVLDPLARPEAYEEYGLDVLSGLLLHGPPGCGKTHLAGALAGEVERSFLPVSPSDVTSKWMGEPANNVADLFTIARANAPCILFIDEIDAIGGSRGAGMNTSEQQMVNQLLTELENVDEGVVVVAATNFVEDVDEALRRSGRFDERVEVPPPDSDARREILEIHLRDRPIDSDAIDWDPIVDATEGYAASDLELLVENAARAAMRADEPVGQSHLESAVAGTESSIADWLDRRDYEGPGETEESSSKPGFYQ